MYDLYDRLKGEFDVSGNPLRTYVWRDEVPVSIIQHGTPEKAWYLEVDHLNTPLAARDQTGKVIWQWASDAFGSVLPNEDPDGDGQKTTINLRFPGQYYDKESGLHYNHRRYYDPELGRYLSPDPIGLAGGGNLYAYVGGNPISYVDPTGEVGLVGAGYGAIAGGIGGYISGGWKGALYGAGTGALVGAVNPWASHWAGGAAGAAAASLLGQGAGNYAAGKSLSDPCNYDFTAAAGAAAGGALGGPLNHAISRYGPQIRLSEIGRAVGSQSVSRSPAMSLGAAAEGIAVGGGELAGTGRCSCSR